MSDKKLKGEAYAEFDSNTGVLRIFRDDAGKYTNGQEDGAKIYFTGIEDITGETLPKWFNERRKGFVTKVIIEDTFRPKTAYGMFSGMTNLTEIEGIKNLDTSECTDMQGMFFGCIRLKNLDVSYFDTSKVTDMSSMFAYCTKLTELDVSHFDTSKVTDMERMFGKCSGLTELDLSGFDTSKVYDMKHMFDCCYCLTNLNVSNFDTSEVINMNSMFAWCLDLTNLDLSYFDTSKVKVMRCMFEGCINITELDLNGFDDSSMCYLEETDYDGSLLFGTDRMFRYCNSLKALYFPDNITLSSGMEIPIGCEVYIGKVNSSEADKLYNVISDIQNKNTEDNSEDIENKKDEVWE